MKKNILCKKVAISAAPGSVLIALTRNGARTAQPPRSSPVEAPSKRRYSDGNPRPQEAVWMEGLNNRPIGRIEELHGFEVGKLTSLEGETIIDFGCGQGKFLEALKDKNLVEIADALTDLLYVTYGAGHAFGIDLDKCFTEVQRSNMSKLGEDGKPIYNEDGKVMKGPNFSKPNLKQFI